MMQKTLVLLIIVCCLSLPASAQGGDLLTKINNLRASLGLHGYTLNSALSAAAQNHASWMAATGQISHTQPDGSTPRTRATAAGYSSSAVSENIYMGTNATANSAWEWWLNSPIHYRGITNAQYTEVGIGSAAGEYGRAFVLVFGNPNGWQAPSRSVASAGNNSAAAAPPSFVVGQDNFGNIMHEIQPGQTLGEIALIYGYSWDDLQTIRDLNELTEEQGRQLSIGAVLLIPPHSGTYTPTPGDPPTATPAPTDAPATDTPPVNTPTPAGVSIGAILRQSATPADATPVPPTAVGTSAVVPEWVVMTADALEVSPTRTAWQAATMTPTPQAVAALPPEDTSMIENTVPEDSGEGGGISPILIVAVLANVLVLGVAGFQYWRRNA